ncbi:hypothetical protein EST38_g13124 [Candolleomyces aberdarensis]|uniref:Uncharacterized protein n=1 Tax=Candolleomyces aberdarensis TaxID=2316362 RepID=A0A4Q2D0N5_9AGAR|nr:hypothetical protein EST38_g13124 [Candolleomyces aberdarensis]
MHDKWESYRTFALLANREATKYEATHHVVIGYFNEATAEGDANADCLVDSSTLAVASTHFPAMLRKSELKFPVFFGARGSFDKKPAEEVSAKHEGVDMTYVSAPGYQQRELEEEGACQAQEEQASGIRKQVGEAMDPLFSDPELPEVPGQQSCQSPKRSPLPQGSAHMDFTPLPASQGASHFGDILGPAPPSS